MSVEFIGVLSFEDSEFGALFHAPDPMVSADISHSKSNAIVAVPFTPLRCLSDLVRKLLVYLDTSEKRIHQVALTVSHSDPRFFRTYRKLAIRRQLGNRLSYLIPGFDGAPFTAEWKAALWDRFFTAAPQRQRRSVERYSIVKTA